MSSQPQETDLAGVDDIASKLNGINTKELGVNKETRTKLAPTAPTTDPIHKISMDVVGSDDNDGREEQPTATAGIGNVSRVLKGVKLLETLNDAEREEIARLMKRCSYATGDKIIKQVSISVQNAKERHANGAL